MLECSKCKEPKTFKEMAIDRRESKGIRTHCKLCHNKKAKAYRKTPKAQATHKEWRAKSARKIAANRLRKYSLTVEKFERLLREQSFSCVICQSEFSESNKPHVDHDHKCCKGQKSCGTCVRGLLCNACNIALGKLKDNAESLRRAIDYVASR